MPSVTKELGGPVGELVMVSAELLHKLPPEPVVTGQYMTLAVEAWIIQLSQVLPFLSVEYEIETDDVGVTVHKGPSALLATPLFESALDKDASNELDRVLQSEG